MTYNDSVDFEWDDTKADGNFKKYGIRFSEAVTVWMDEAALEIPDTEHSSDTSQDIQLISTKANRDSAPEILGRL